MEKIIKYLKLLYKKYKLLYKYKPNRGLYIETYSLMRSDLDFMHWFEENYGAEVRCYNRIKKLK